jgi:hypothetical protein
MCGCPRFELYTIRIQIKITAGASFLHVVQWVQGKFLSWIKAARTSGINSYLPSHSEGLWRMELCLPIPLHTTTWCQFIHYPSNDNGWSYCGPLQKCILITEEQNTVVAIANRLRAGRSEFRIPVETRDSFVLCLCCPPSLLFSWYQGYSGGKGAEALKLTTRFHLVLRLRMSGAGSLLPPFMARICKTCLFKILLRALTQDRKLLPSSWADL